MPALGTGVRSAEVLSWRKAVGDRVVAGEPLAVVSTDKVETEVEAPVHGYLSAVRVPAGGTAAVGDALASIRIATDHDG